ncbi:MAG: hypothetical protein IKI74_03275 [Christensenellaceae bacterium]|nr:hypothetical protein [Christensenellaceae bacterium]
MKKPICILLIILTVISCASCMKKEEDLPEATPSAMPAVTEETGDDEEKQEETLPDDTAADKGPEEDGSHKAEEDAGTDEEDISPLPLYYEATLEDFENKSGSIFSYDIDGDGEDEELTWKLDEKEWDLDFSWGDNEFSVKCMYLERAILTDLDRSSPFINLIITADYASNDFQVNDFRIENGKVEPHRWMWGDMHLEDGKIINYEATNCLGTGDGKRPYAGDELEPETEWLEDVTIERYSASYDRNKLIDMGVILTASKDIPCEIDGKESVIPKGSIVEKKAFRSDGTACEVRVEGMGKAVIKMERNAKDYQYYIAGELQDNYFKKIMYAG